MLRFLILALSLLMMPSAFAQIPQFPKRGSIPFKDFDPALEGSKDGQMIIFSGKLIGIENVQEVCPPNHICLDARYQVRFQVSEVFKGEYTGKTIDFIAYDHYGTPRFTQFEHVMIYAQQFDGKLYHRKYQFDPLFTLKDGRLAFCGDPYVDYEEDQLEEYGRDPLNALQFQPAVKARMEQVLRFVKDYRSNEMEQFQEQIRERFLDDIKVYAPPAWIYKRGTFTCKMGVSASKLSDIRYLYEYSTEAED